jgi:hypothetical protein
MWRGERQAKLIKRAAVASGGGHDFKRQNKPVPNLVLSTPIDIQQRPLASFYRWFGKGLQRLGSGRFDRRSCRVGSIQLVW